jgi:3-oxoadipate enol-lactonase
LTSPLGGVACLVNGTGRPVTVFLPGLGGSIDHLRPLGGGVAGTRVFCELSGDDAPDDFAGLARTFRTVADRFDADRALGVSLGAGALLRILSETPTRFARVVLYLPSALAAVTARRREQLAAMVAMAEMGDVHALSVLLGEELPVAVRATRPAVDASKIRAERLASPEGLRLLNNLAAGAAPVDGPLDAVTAQVLVIGAAGDDVHPVGVAEEIAAALPYARLHVFETPAPLWHARAELRALVSGWLSA